MKAKLRNKDGNNVHRCSNNRTITEHDAEHGGKGKTVADTENKSKII